MCSSDLTLNILFNLVALGTSIKLVSWAARSRSEGLASGRITPE